MDNPVLAPTDTPVTGTFAGCPAAVVEPASSPIRRWYHHLLWYGVAAAVTVAVLFAGLRLDRADFAAPFQYDYDVLLILPFVKSTVETGTHWHNDRLGAPGIQELHDFPVVDHLHFGIIRLLGLILGEPVVVFNVYHLLTYPLATLSAMFVLRRFGLSVPAAMAGGLLYSFQPYHYLRGEIHYFLAAYYVVPLTLMVTLWVCQGRLPFFRRRPDGTYRVGVWTADTVAAVLIGAATASAGAYYAFFGCALLVAAGAYGWAAVRTWRAAASAAGVVGVVVVGGLVNHAPTFPYQYENGRNSRPHVRMAEDAERYGMKIAQLVLPVAQHNPVGLGEEIILDPAALRSEYQAPQFKEMNETDWDPLGLIGAVGYLVLLLAVVLPIRRGWPFSPLSALTVFATLLGTCGGLGTVFNYTVSPQVRCYNRICIYIAFLALFAVVWWLDRFLLTRTGWARRLHRPAFVALVLFGLWDQTNDQWFPDARIPRPGYLGVVGHRDEAARQYWEDRAFFERVERLLPEGGMVFTYPYMEYPEGQPYREPGGGEKLESYELVIGYLHTRSVRWSYGAMKGREWDNWHREAAGLAYTGDAAEFLRKLAFGGFDGLLVDARPLSPKRWGELKTSLERYGASFREFHPGRQLYYFDLTGHRDYLRRSYGSAGFDARATAEREKLTVLWLKGFNTYEPVGYEWRSHWSTYSSELVFVNRSGKTRTVTARMVFRAGFKGPAKVKIRGGDFWSDEVEFDADGTPYSRELVIPPGRYTVRLKCIPGVSVLPTDSRKEIYTVGQFRLEEVPGRP